jgi:hypothetical protein
MTKCVCSVLESGADSVIFPNDAGDLNSAEKLGARGQAMFTALVGGLCPKGAKWRYVRKQENPLWVASDNKELRTKLAKDRGGNNTLHTDNFLHPEDSFVEFTYTSLPLIFYTYTYI